MKLNNLLQKFDSFQAEKVYSEANQPVQIIFPVLGFLVSFSFLQSYPNLFGDYYNEPDLYSSEVLTIRDFFTFRVFLYQCCLCVYFSIFIVLNHKEAATGKS